MTQFADGARRFGGRVSGTFGREPWASALLVGALAVAVRLVLAMMSIRPMFMSDSGTYLRVVHDFFMPPDRPVGVSAFYSGLFRVAHDLRMIVVGQALLGVLSSMLTAVVALQCGLRVRYARAVGLAMAVSPTALVYERVVLAETLVVFLGLLATALFLSALDSGLYGRAVVAGLVAGGIVTVRTNNTVFLLALALLAAAAGPMRVVRTRVGLLCALVASSSLAIVGYAALNYVDSAARHGAGTFALSQFDGISLFARNAEFTDCSRPEAPPAIRVEICAEGPDYLQADAAEIIWAEGPVYRAIGGADGARKNAELRQLAVENMRAHPVQVIQESARTAWHNLTASDRRYAVRAVDIEPAGSTVARFFGPDEASAGSAWFGNALQDVYFAWTRVRPVIWLTALVAVGTAMTRRWRLNRVGVLSLGGFVLPLAAVAVTGVPTARYVAPFEPVAFLSFAWVTQLAIDRWRRVVDGEAVATADAHEDAVPGEVAESPAALARLSDEERQVGGGVAELARVRTT